jgi:hypothetical protein
MPQVDVQRHSGRCRHIFSGTVDPSKNAALLPLMVATNSGVPVGRSKDMWDELMCTVKRILYSKNSITLEFTVSCTYILYSKTSVQYLEFTVSCTKSKTVNSATSPKIV